MKYYIDENMNEGSYEELERIEEKSFEIDLSETFPKDIPDGFPVMSDGRKMNLFKSDISTCVIGGTGSGKTTRIILPELLALIHSQKSLVIHDPKSEIYRYLYPILEKNGYHVVVMDFWDPKRGVSYNPLGKAQKLYRDGETAKSDDILQNFYGNIMNAKIHSDKDPFWAEASTSYICGLTELAFDVLPKENITIEDVYNLHIEANRKVETEERGRIGMVSKRLLDLYCGMHTDKPYYKLIYPYLQAPPETRGSIEATLFTAISSLVRNEDIIDFCSHSEFDPIELAEQKTALFLITRDDSSTHEGLVSSIIDQIYGELRDAAMEKYNGRLPRKTVFVLEELGMLGPINDFDRKIAICRGINIAFCIVVQSLEQLRHRYGDLANLILGSCNLVFLNSNDETLLEYISNLCGKRKDNYTQETHQLLSPERLRLLEMGQVLFLMQRTRPFITYMPYIDAYGMKPMGKCEIPIRKPHPKEPAFDLQKLVMGERKKRATEKEKREKSLAEQLASQLMNDMDTAPNITFEEWRAMRRKEMHRKMDEELKRMGESKAEVKEDS